MTAVRQLRIRNWPLSSAFSLARPEDLSRNVSDGPSRIPNTSYRAATPLHLKEYACGHLGLRRLSVWNGSPGSRTHPTELQYPCARMDTPVAIWGCSEGRAMGINRGATNHSPVHHTETDRQSCQKTKKASQKQTDRRMDRQRKSCDLRQNEVSEKPVRNRQTDRHRQTDRQTENCDLRQTEVSQMPSRNRRTGTEREGGEGGERDTDTER